MSKPELQWTEEERKAHKDYEKKVQELQEEQEKYRKVGLISTTITSIYLKKMYIYT